MVGFVVYLLNRCVHRGIPSLAHHYPVAPLMRTFLLIASWFVIVPAGAMAQQMAGSQRPTFTPPTVTPQLAAPLASGNYKLKITLPPKPGTSGQFVRHFNATLTHTGSSIVVALAGGTPLQGTLSGSSITLQGAGPGGSSMTLPMTASPTGASGTVVISVSSGQHASGTSTLERIAAGGPAGSARGHGSDGNLCSNWLTCFLRDYLDITIDPMQ